MSSIPEVLRLVRRQARCYHLQPVSLAVSLSRNGMPSKPMWAYLLRQSARAERDIARSTLSSLARPSRLDLATPDGTESACRGSQRWSNAPAFDVELGGCTLKSALLEEAARSPVPALFAASVSGASLTASSISIRRCTVSSVGLMRRCAAGNLLDGWERCCACCDLLGEIGGHESGFLAGARMTVNSCSGAGG